MLGLLDDPTSLFNYGLIPSVSTIPSYSVGRAVVSETINASDFLKDMGDDLPNGVRVEASGTLTVSYDDENDFPIKANGNPKIAVEVEIPQSITQTKFLYLLGILSAEGRINNINIEEDKYSGSVNYTISLGVGIADIITQKKWVKFIGSITYAVDLDKDFVKLVLSLKAYGTGENPICEFDKTLTEYSVQDIIDRFES